MLVLLVVLGLWLAKPELFPSWDPVIGMSDKWRELGENATAISSKESSKWRSLSRYESRQWRKESENWRRQSDNWREVSREQSDNWRASFERESRRWAKRTRSLTLVLLLWALPSWFNPLRRTLVQLKSSSLALIKYTNPRGYLRSFNSLLLAIFNIRYI